MDAPVESATATRDPGFAMGMREFLAMMASLMALNALAIDAMLPAFPAIGDAFGIVRANDTQYVISAYLFGLGLGAIVYGPLADRFGRRPVILGALAGYAIFAALGGIAPDFTLLLIARFAQGLAAAAMGVLAIAVIRDRTSGDAMARLVSLVFIVFMAVPILAPSIGQLILWFAHWRVIFALFVLLSSGLAIWVWLRLPETLKPDAVIPISPRAIARTWAKVVFHRNAFGHVVASGIVMGALFGFINSSQQVFADVFDAVEIFPIAFASVAATMAVSNWFNSRIVERFGARRVSQTALIAFIMLSLAQLGSALVAPDSFALFLILIALNMAMVGFTGSNLSSISMQPFGMMAGAASSFQMFARTVLSAGLGAVIGQAFDGRVVPLATGFLLCGTSALIFVWWAESWQPFRRLHPAPAKTE